MRDLPESCVETDTLLRKRGFKCREVETEDMHSRWCYYFKDFRQSNSNVMIRVEMQFDLWIHDAPFGSYDDNHDLNHESTYLVVFHRQMEKEEDFFDDDFYDEDTEKLRKISKYPLSVYTFEELEGWMEKLT